MEAAALLLAIVAVGVMGFAIQRGATCTVAAMEEIVTLRRFGRLLALVEASLWVGGGLVLLNAAGLLSAMPAGYAAGITTIGGGVLLGLGAFVNRACVFGAIARLGSGEWAYLATPLGFYFGSLAALGVMQPVRLAGDSRVLAAPAWVVVLVAALLGSRLATHAIAIRRGRIADHVWSPHVATSVIGITFLAALLAAGSWTYTELLAELARGMSASLAPRLLMLFALLTGAVFGGWTAGKIRLRAPTAARVARCLAGGAMMGAGSALIPGGNDGLILVGMPLLWPYAWLAFATMCIAVGLMLRIAMRTAGQ